MEKPRQSGGIRIGDVSGGIHGSIIAGRDVQGAIVTVGEHAVSVDKVPTVDEFRQLLAGIQEQLAEIVIQQEALQTVSPAAPFIAQGAVQSVNAAVEEVEETVEVKADEAKTVQERLTEATSLLSGILDDAKAVAEKNVEVSGAVKPLAEQLGPLVEKLHAAAFWVVKLWLQD